MALSISSINNADSLYSFKFGVPSAFISYIFKVVASSLSLNWEDRGCLNTFLDLSITEFDLVYSTESALLGTFTFGIFCYVVFTDRFSLSLTWRFGMWPYFINCLSYSKSLMCSNPGLYECFLSITLNLGLRLDFILRL